MKATKRLEDVWKHIFSESEPRSNTVERLAQSNQILIQELEHKRKILERTNAKYQALKAEVSEVLVLITNAFKE